MTNTNTFSAIDLVVTKLNDNSILEDPWETTTGVARGNWWHTDRPGQVPNQQFPRGQVIKIDNPTEIISIDYTGWERLILNLYFYTKRNWKYDTGSENISNERLVEYYINKIKDQLKTNNSALSPLGGFLASNTSTPVYDAETKCWVASVTIRVWWFNIGTTAA